MVDVGIVVAAIKVVVTGKLKAARKVVAMIKVVYSREIVDAGKVVAVIKVIAAGKRWMPRAWWLPQERW